MGTRQPLEGHSAKKPAKRHLLNLTLGTMPELKYFDTEEDRQRALQEIGAEAGNIASAGFWFAIVLLVFSVLGMRFLAGWLLSYVQWHHEVEDLIRVVAMIGAGFLVLRKLHRWGAAADLRRKLLAANVPVCVKCGYLLRGLPLDPGRCPECGTAFSEEVISILEKAAPRAGDVGQRESPSHAAD